MADTSNDNVNKPYKGLHTDNDPSEQPAGTYRFALNGVNESSEGDQQSITNEESNISTTDLPIGYLPIGSVYISDGTTVLFSRNDLLSKDEIGLVGKDSKYSTLVNTSILSFSINSQIDAQFRVRKNNERYIYWVDGINEARSFNIDDLYTYYSDTYKNYLAVGGNPNNFTGEQWSITSFELLRSYQEIPRFGTIEIVPYGSTKSGSYNFGIMYVDSDNNPTEVVAVSNTVRIFVDSESNPFQSIRGSRDTQTQVQSYTSANKSISVTLTNLDTNFPYYQVVVIQATQGTGSPTKALLLPKQSVNTPTFIYSGNDDQLADIPLSSVSVDPALLLAPKHIEQLENRLLLASVEGSNYNWCDFQPYASKIGADLTTESVILNSVLSDPNIKSANSSYKLTGYMPGDVISIGIIYLMKGNIYSPVFHIPGKAFNNTTSAMDFYEVDNINYEDIHNCDGLTNYWGVDYNSNLLKNTRVRHHKFPSRASAGIPLIESVDTTIVLTKYRLKYNFTLASGKTYPVDANGDPLSIDLVINYTQVGSSTEDVLTVSLTSQDLSFPQTFYDDTSDLQSIYTQGDDSHFQFDPTSSFWATYMNPGNETFVIDYIYEPYTLDTIYNTTNSRIFGIELLSIEKPHQDCIGFFIVRNERLDTDKLIVDNAIMGTNIISNEYSTFTHICTEFPAYLYDTRASWFFSPEHEFYGKNPQFNQVNIEGFYTATNKYTFPCTPDAPCYPMHDKETGNAPPGAGWYNAITVRDVMAGTSYDPSIDSKNSKDTDGFALVVPYRARDFSYSLDNTYSPLLKKNQFYLNATANKIIDEINFYNVSCDNKIGMVEFANPINATDIYTANSPNNSISYSVEDRAKFTAQTPAIKRLAYVSLVNENKVAYQDFMVRDYFKEHHNAVLFNNDIVIDSFRVFNGDTNISALNFITSMFIKLDFADRQKKKKWWQIVVGSVLIAVAIVVNVIPGIGQALSAVGIAAGVAVLSATAIGIGVALISSGIKFDQMKNMIEQDYDKGLLAAVNDWDVSGMIDSAPFGGDLPNMNLGDDNIQWFADRANNIYIETSVPFGLRCGVTAGVPDFIDAPVPYKDDEFRNYLIEKLTTIDRDQGDGRLYRGFPTAEVYDMNLDYTRKQKEKIYIHLPDTYNCCGDNAEKFPLRIHYSEQSFQEELTDNYKTFLPQNYRDIEGEHGIITDLYKVGDNLFIHTKESLWQLPANLQEQVTSEFTTFIGTGEFFSIPPKKVIDDKLGSGGSQHKWATTKTEVGVFFVNDIEHKIYIHGERILDITLGGNKNWFRNNLKSNLIQQIYNKTGIDIDIDNNPANPNGVGYHSIYDNRHERFILTKKDYLISNFYLQNLFVTTEAGLAPVPENVLVFDISSKSFKMIVPGHLPMTQRVILIDLGDPTYFENKSYTISYSVKDQQWISWHSYLPNFYFNTQDNLFSTISTNTGIWKHNVKDSFQTFYGIQYSHILEYVSNSSPVQERIWEDISLITKAESYDITSDQFYEIDKVTHNKITIYNQRQCSGELLMIPKMVDEDYLFEQISNEPGQIIIGKTEDTWNLNNLRDYRTSYQTPIFSSNWSDTQLQYPIDKVVRNSDIDFNKDWSQIESFRSKFVVIRLKFDNFATVKLTTRYSIEGQQISGR